jgi:hypothetical protein
MKINCETAQVQEVGYSETSVDDIVSNPTDWYDLVANEGVQNSVSVNLTRF